MNLIWPTLRRHFSCQKILSWNFKHYFLMCFNCMHHASRLKYFEMIFIVRIFIVVILLFSVMSMQNLVTALLALAKLNSENFHKWKSNLNLMMMICESQICLHWGVSQGTTDAKSVRDKYDAWIQSNNKAKCFMLVSMEDVLRKTHEHMENAYEIMDSLQAMFGQ